MQATMLVVLREGTEWEILIEINYVDEHRYVASELACNLHRRH